jgi:hypothetical protein
MEERGSCDPMPMLVEVSGDQPLSKLVGAEKAVLKCFWLREK